MEDDKGYHRNPSQLHAAASVYNFKGSRYVVQVTEPRDWHKNVYTPAQASNRRVATPTATHTTSTRTREASSNATQITTTSRPAPLAVHEDYVVMELEKIVADDVDQAGVMRFRCWWKGYDDSDDDTWELPAAFEDNPRVLLDWLKGTNAVVPALQGVESIVSFAPQGGYMIRRTGQAQGKQEWCPVEMVPIDAIRQFAEADEDIDQLSDDDEMEVDEQPTATPAESSHQSPAKAMASTSKAPRIEASVTLQGQDPNPQQMEVDVGNGPNTTMVDDLH